MKSANGLARVPLLIAVLVVAGGGATFQLGGRHSGETREAAATVVTAASADAESEVAFLGEMTVSASRIRD